MTPKTETIFFRDADMPGIDICRVKKSSHHFPEHFHDDIYLVGLIFSGHCYCLGRKRQDAASGPGGITLLNPGQIHSGVPAGDGLLDYAICHISLDAMARMTREMEFYPGRPFEFSATLMKDPLVAGLLKNLFKTMLSSQDSLEREAVMISTCHFLFSRYGLEIKNQNADRLRHQKVVRARELLACDLDRKITLAQVSQSVGLSQYHFLRTFKRETGTSPHLYRTLKRVEAARTLLKKGTPQALVALETGFSDQSHFSKTFHRYMGVTPGQFLAR